MAEKSGKTVDPFDVEALEKSLNDSAGRVSAIWLSFVAFTAYLAAAVSNLSHRQIFLDEPIKLPTVNIDLPLAASAILLPLLFVIYHAYVLLQVVLLARTANAYNETMVRTVPFMAEREGLRQRLANTLFAQLFAGSRREREGFLGWLLRLMAWVTLAIAPVSVLLIFQLKFLPYHEPAVTWTHRGLIAVDLLNVLLLWAGAVDPASDITFRMLWDRWKSGLGAVVVLALSCLLLTFPGESNRGWMKHLRSADQDTGKISLCQLPQLVTMLRLTNIDRITLPNEDFIDYQKLDRITKSTTEQGRHPSEGERTRDFHGRDLACADLTNGDLQRANFFRAFMPGVRLAGAKLQGASLNEAHLPEASFDGAQLQGASLQQAELRNAGFSSASMQNVRLAKANLPNARLPNANLRGAVLDGAVLIKADLTAADMRSSSLKGALLPGAQLSRIQLQNAIIENAQLQGAYLAAGQFERARVVNSNFDGASLVLAVFERATIGGTSSFNGTFLDDAQFHGAQFIASVQLQNASLTRTAFQGAWLPYAHLEGAILTGAKFQGAVLPSTFLEGAMLNEANFDGALIINPRFQGASLERASSRYTVFSNVDPRNAGSIDCSAARVQGPVESSQQAPQAPTPSNEPQVAAANRWKDCERRSASDDRMEFDRAHVFLLRSVICLDPAHGGAIAEGIIEYFGEQGADSRSLSATLASDLLGLDSDGCLAKKNFSETTLERLRAAKAIAPPSPVSTATRP